MITEVLGGTGKIFRYAWWRLAAIGTVTFAALTAALWGISELVKQIAVHNRSTFTLDGTVTHGGGYALIAILAVLVLVVGSEIVFAGIAAATRVADDVRTGRRPSALRGAAQGLRLALPALVTVLFAVAVFAALFVLSPLTTLAGLLGLLATAVLRLVRRWRPGAVAWWPSVRTLVVVAVPFVLALYWAARTSLVLPAMFLEGFSPAGAVRRSAQATRGRPARVLGVLALGGLVTLVLLSGACAIGWAINHVLGLAIAQTVATFLVVALPMVVATLAYRRPEPRSGWNGGRPAAAGRPARGVELDEVAPAGLGLAVVAVAWRAWRRSLTPSARACGTALGAVAGRQGALAGTSRAVAGGLDQQPAGRQVPPGPTGRKRPGPGRPVRGASVGLAWLLAAVVAVPGLVLSAGPAGATTTTVTFTVTDTTGSACAAGGACSFANAATDVQNDMAAGTATNYVIQFGAAFPPAAPLTVGAAFNASLHPSTITIDGTGHQVDLVGNHSSPIFTFAKGTTFHLKNLELSNNQIVSTTPFDTTFFTYKRYSSGVQALFGASGSLDNVTIYDNSIGTRSSRAGALYVTTGGYVSTTNTTFINNYRGALIASGTGTTVTALNDTFVGTQTTGDAIGASTGASVTVDNSALMAAFGCYTASGGTVTGAGNVWADTSDCGTGRSNVGYTIAKDPMGVDEALNGIAVPGKGWVPTANILPIIHTWTAGTTSPGPVFNVDGPTGPLHSPACPPVDARGFTTPNVDKCSAGASQYDPAVTVTISRTFPRTTSSPTPTVGPIFQGTHAGFRATVTMAMEPTGSSLAVTGPVPMGTLAFFLTGQPVHVFGTKGTTLHPTGLGVQSQFASFTGLTTPPYDYENPLLPVGTDQITAELVATTPTLFVSTLSAPYVQTVLSKQGQASISSTPGPDSVLGTSVTFTVAVGGYAGGAMPEGAVDLLDGGVSVDGGAGQTLVAGQATFTVPSLTQGTHAMTATFTPSNGTYQPSVSPAYTQDVRVAPTMTLSPSSPITTVYGNTTTITATVHVPVGEPVPSGTVTFTAGTVPYAIALGTGPDDEAAVTLPTTLLAPQDGYAVAVAYGGDTGYTPATASATVDIVAAGTTTTLTAPGSGGSAVFGTQETLAAQVAAIGTSKSPTGLVAFYSGTTELGTAPVQPTGQASYLTGVGQLPAGGDALTARYLGTTTTAGATGFSASTSTPTTFTVTTAPTTVTMTSGTNPTVHGQATTLVATVTAGDGSPAVPTGSVTFYSGSTAVVSGVGVGSDGKATASVTTLPAGTDQLTAAYTPSSTGFSSGDSDGSPVTQTVDKAAALVTLGVSPASSPQPYGTEVTFTVTVTAVAPGAGTPTGTVAIEHTGLTPAPTGTLSPAPSPAPATQAEVTVGPVLVQGTLHTLRAAYAGDGGFDGGTSPAMAYDVTAAATSSVLSATPTTSTVGQAVTLTATVATTAPAPAPTGTVSFLDGNTAVAGCSTPVTLTPLSAEASTATCTTSSLASGAHTLSFTYSGAPDFNASPSNQVTESVDHIGTTTTLSASPLPGSVATPTTLTATVARGGGSGTPTGTVTFTDQTTDGTVTLGTATVVGGQAQLTVPLLPGGPNGLTATYSGDGTFGGSSSTPVDDDVAKAATSVTVSITSGGTPAGPSIPYGTPVTLTATATAAGGPTPTGPVTLSFGSLSRQVTLATGRATLHLTTLPVGSGPVTATYGGDVYDNGATGTSTHITVSPDTTSLSLSATPNPAHAGAPVTLTATVTNGSGTGATPSGTVTFSVGATVVGTAPLAGSGTAATATVRWTTPAGTATTTIVATFSATASGGFAGSSGSVAVRSTKLATTTFLYPTSYPYTSFVGSSYDFTTQVQRADLFGSDLPTGNVVISDGHGDTCTAALTATVHAGGCALRFAHAGTYQITATYEGDGNFLPSTSTPMAFTVYPGGVTMTASATPGSQWVLGTAITIRWSVTGVPGGTGGTVTAHSLQAGGPSCTSTSLVGSCTLTFPPNVGFYGEIVVGYSGTTDYGPKTVDLFGTFYSCVTSPAIANPGGTVTVLTPPNCQGNGYLVGTPITVQATASPGYAFYGWSDGSTYYQESTFAGTPEIATFVPDFGTLNFRIDVVTGNTAAGRLSPLTPFPSCGSWQSLGNGGYTGCFSHGTSATIQATVVENGYQFYGWLQGSAPLSTTPTITVPGGNDLTLTAVYGPYCMTTVVGLTTTGPGTVTSTGPAFNCFDPFVTGGGWTGTPPMSVTATASADSYFTGWTWNGFTAAAVLPKYLNFAIPTRTATTSTVTLGYPGAGTLTAHFGSCVQLTTSVNHSTYGSVTVSPTGNCPSMGAGWYETGSQVTVTARPKPNYGLQSVSGLVNTSIGRNIGGIAQTWRVVLTSNQSLTANFYYVYACQPLTLSVVPGGTATISYTDTGAFTNPCPSGYYNSSAGTYNDGGTVTFSVHSLQYPQAFNVVKVQTNDQTGRPYKPVIEPSAYLTRQHLNGASSVTAYACEVVNPQITLISPNGARHSGPAPSGTSFLEASPAPNCPVQANGWLVGTVVTFGALGPTPGYTFDGYTGTDTTNANPYQVIDLDGSRATIPVTATYSVNCGTLSYHATEVGDTHLTVGPAGNCPDTTPSSHRYILGTTVALYANSASNHDFTGWTGALQNTATANPTWVTVNGDTTVTAYYSRQSVGTRIKNAIVTTLANGLAGSAKQLVGVVAPMVAAVVQGPLGVISGIATLLTKCGLHATWLTGISQTIAAMTAALNCANAWSESTPPASTGKAPTYFNATAQTGRVGAAGFGAALQITSLKEAQATYAEALAAKSAGGNVAGSEGSLTYYSQDLESAESDLLVTKTFTGFAAIGVAAAVGTSIYQEVESGPSVNFQANAAQAWTTGGDVYTNCLINSVPDYTGVTKQEFLT